LHSKTVQRGDLLARLDAGLTRKLTLVAAPTGFGKTTLVRQWIESRGFASAWVTLDGYDNDPSRFWTYIVSALRIVDSSIGKNTLSALMTPQPPSFQTLLTPLLNELEGLEIPCVLVLEDYHVITTTEINDAVSFLIQNLPDALHLVLITRNDPDLPLAILRVREDLIEIDSAALRFNAQEAQAFLDIAVPFELPSTAVAQLLEKTEGWAAGLRLVALSLQNRSHVGDINDLIQSFSGSDPYIADYLIQEVFESQPEDIRSFLLKTCFFRRLTGSLCDAITDTKNGAFILERLERDNLFIEQLERGGNQNWYRYNSLFAESIQYLARQKPGDAGIELLFEKASGWYEQHGLYDEAIETALTARLFTHVMSLIEKFIEIHDLTELQTLGRWLEDIPEKEIFLRPEICFNYAQVILYSSSDRFAPATAGRLEPYLRVAESAWQSKEHHPRLGQVLSLRGIVAWWQGDFPKAFEYAHRSLQILAEEDVFWRGNSLLIVSYEALADGRIFEAQDNILEARALLGAAQNIHGILAAIQILSQVFYWQGELEQAEQLNQQIVAEAVGEESMLDDQGFAALSLADIAYEKNDLSEAEQLATRAVNLAVQRGNEYLQTQATIRLAYIQAARNDFQRADEFVKPLVRSMRNPTLLREIQEAQSRLSILSGDLVALKGWQTLVSIDKEVTDNAQKEREIFTLARIRIAEGAADEALGLLQDRAAQAAENGRVRSQLTALCLEALAHYANFDLTQATKVLSEALSIGQAKELRRVFLDEGQRMAALILAILPALPSRTLSLFATTLLHAFPPEAIAHLTATDSGVKIEALSPQEIRVLRLLVTGLSNADIARELVVSQNTVKTHVKSIYRKLNVKSRDEAREVTRELRLL
jgi:LuxR family maltose regulon positive regulatory protein